MSRRKLYFVVLVVFFAIPAAHAATNWPIGKSANGRYFVDSTGAPWMMVGDAGHHLMCQITQPSWAAYLQSRQSFGFNTVNVEATRPGTNCVYNTGQAADGTYPFTTGTSPSTYDVSTPNPAYWNEVDAFINQAASYGLVVALMPMPWGDGYSATFKNNGATKMFNFGAYLGNRYKNFPNIIWNVGQDFDGSSFPSSTNLNLMAQFMAGIASTDPNHIIDCQLNYFRSYSTQGNSNSTYAANLTSDFVYTYYEVYDEVLTAYASTPILPLFLGETNYENGNNTGALSSLANAFITRQEMWYAMTSGAAGHIWGNEDVNHFDSLYQSNLNTTATSQVKFLPQLFNAYPWWTFAPDCTSNCSSSASHALVTAGFGTYNGSNGNMYNATYAATTWDGANTSITYTPASTTLTINLSKFANPVTAIWYDPTLGSSTTINGGTPYTNSGSQTFTTPATAHADGTHDWVLVLSAGSTTPPPPPPSYLCDIDNDGSVSVTDVQIEVNMALGLRTCTNPSGTCTVLSVQRVVNAALGLACVAP